MRWSEESLHLYNIDMGWNELESLHFRRLINLISNLINFDFF